MEAKSTHGPTEGLFGNRTEGFFRLDSRRTFLFWSLPLHSIPRTVADTG